MVGSISGGLASLATDESEQPQHTRDAAQPGVRGRRRHRERTIAQRALNRAPRRADSSTDATINAITIRVDWVNVCGAVQIADGSVVSQRNVIFAACLNTGSPCSDTAVPCGARHHPGPGQLPTDTRRSRDQDLRAVMERQPMRRRERTRSTAEFSLHDELIIAVVLSLLIGGVVVAALITSLNVSDTTTEQVGDSTDAGFITALPHA